MESIHSLEKTLADFYKGMPHLPEAGRSWLASNAWWLVIIGVVLGAMAILALVPLLLLSFGLSSMYGGMAGVNGMYVSSYGGLFWLSAIVSLAGLALVIFLQAIAIAPLKALKKKGWDLLFLAFLVNIVLTAVSDVLSYSFGSLIGLIIGAAIGGYFLFEVRAKFGGVKVLATDKKPEFKAATDKPATDKAAK